MNTAVISLRTTEHGGVIYETNIATGDSGTEFPYGDLIKFQSDEHRRDYSHFDAMAVADMVNQSSWLGRAGR